MGDCCRKPCQDTKEKGHYTISKMGTLNTIKMNNKQSHSVSVIIPTLNEESNIAQCINSVKESNDIIVYDSYSTDQTVQISKELGARVYKRKWEHESAHKNWALENIEYKNRWVFHLDADERMTPELWEEVLGIANDEENSYAGYYCGRLNFFMAKCIKHSYPPVPILRFYIPSNVRYEREINPRTIVNGRVGTLENLFEHFSFSKGLTEWIEKHNRYSLAEAREAIKDVGEETLRWKNLFSSDRAERRGTLKKIAWKMPFRPVLKFCYLYFLKFGFLDGLPGLRYCTLMGIYEYMIDLKIREIRLIQRGGRL